MVYCWRTRDESNPSAASIQQQRKVLILPPTRDYEQIGRSYFVSHVWQIGALASVAGQGRDYEQSGRSYFVSHVWQTVALGSEAGQG